MDLEGEEREFDKRHEDNMEEEKSDDEWIGQDETSYQAEAEFDTEYTLTDLPTPSSVDTPLAQDLSYGLEVESPSSNVVECHDAVMTSEQQHRTPLVLSLHNPSVAQVIVEADISPAPVPTSSKTIPSILKRSTQTLCEKDTFEKIAANMRLAPPILARCHSLTIVDDVTITTTQQILLSKPKAASSKRTLSLSNPSSLTVLNPVHSSFKSSTSLAYSTTLTLSTFAATSPAGLSLLPSTCPLASAEPSSPKSASVLAVACKSPKSICSFVGNSFSNNSGNYNASSSLSYLMQEQTVASKQIDRNDYDEDSECSLDSLIDNFELTPRTPTASKLPSNVHSNNVYLSGFSYSSTSTSNSSVFCCLEEDGHDYDDDSSLDNLFDQFGCDEEEDRDVYDDMSRDIAFLSSNLILTDI